MRDLVYKVLSCRIPSRSKILASLAMVNALIVLYTMFMSSNASSQAWTSMNINSPTEPHGTLNHLDNKSRVKATEKQTNFPSLHSIHQTLQQESQHKFHTINLNTKRALNTTRGLDTTHKVRNYFMPRNTKFLEDKFRDLLFHLDQLMSEKGMTYFLYGGSLLGSYRHHGLIPWDDDVDLIISFSQRRLLYSLLQHLPPKYQFSAPKTCSWKMYMSSAQPINGLPWKWPYVDIFFYQENATHIWDVCAAYISQFSFKKSDIFPLRRRPFLGLNLLAPRDPKAVLEHNYKVQDCESSSLVHRWEIVKQPFKVPCESLHSLHPFVSRYFLNGGCNETLRHQGKVTNVFFDWGVHC